MRLNQMRIIILSKHMADRIEKLTNKPPVVVATGVAEGEQEIFEAFPDIVTSIPGLAMQAKLDKEAIVSDDGSVIVIGTGETLLK